MGNKWYKRKFIDVEPIKDDKALRKFANTTIKRMSIVTGEMFRSIANKKWQKICQLKICWGA